MLRPILVFSMSVCFACTTNDPTSTESGSSGAEPATAASETGPGTGTGTTGGQSSDTTGSAATGPGPTTGPGPDPTTGTTAEPTTTTDTTGAAAVSFTDVYEQVIMPHGCNAGYCHGGGAGGLEMTDEATSYANLVEVQAVAPVCGQSVRLVPGSLDESVLWYRVRPAALDGGDPCADGHKMPKGSTGVSDSEAQLVADWISGGALE